MSFFTLSLPILKLDKNALMDLYNKTAKANGHASTIVDIDTKPIEVHSDYVHYYARQEGITDLVLLAQAKECDPLMQKISPPYNTIVAMKGRAPFDMVGMKHPTVIVK